MQKTLRYLLIIVTAITFASKVYAQGGKVGINTTMPAAMLHVKDSSVLFSAAAGLPPSPGQVPALGAGTRMMWYPAKAAFRTGGVSGGHWNRDSIGDYSFAAGYNTKALGMRSFAIGENSRAFGTNSFAAGSGTHSLGDNSISIGLLSQSSGYASIACGQQAFASGDYSRSFGFNTKAYADHSTAFGYFSQATGQHSTAFGRNTLASGFYSTAMGYYTKASGENSISFGTNTYAKSYNSFVLGRYNDTSSVSSIEWNIYDPLFIVGNGTSNSDRRNAFTILKNGRIGINVQTPVTLLHLVKSFSPYGLYHGNTAFLVESAYENAYMTFVNTGIHESGILSGNEYTGARSGIIFKADSTLHLRSGGNDTRLLLANNGNIGFNTITPDALTHIVRNNPTNGPYFGNVISIWESDLNSYVQFSNANNRECGFLSGNTNTAIRSGLVFAADSSVRVHTGGNFIKMFLDKNGKMGLGTNTPDAILHARKASSSVTPNINSVGIFESNAPNYVSILTPANIKSGIAFGVPAGDQHGGMFYNDPVALSGLVFRANNAIRMVINGNGNVGIGTTDPQDRLHVVDGVSTAFPNANSLAIIENNATAYINILTPVANEAGLLFGNASNNAHGCIIYNNPSTPSGLQFRTNGNTTRMVIDDIGNVGIGTNVPTEKLHVVGDICYTGSIAACSDIRYKKDFEKIEDVLGKLQAIDAYYYNWNTEKFDSLGFTEEKQIGVIAQEIAKVFPEIVSQDDAGYFRVDYSRLSVILLSAVKEHQQIISDQSSTIQKQQMEIGSLRDRLDAIEGKLNVRFNEKQSVGDNQ